jgi:hypothetical protein
MLNAERGMHNAIINNFLSQSIIKRAHKSKHLWLPEILISNREIFDSGINSGYLKTKTPKLLTEV